MKRRTFLGTLAASSTAAALGDRELQPIAPAKAKPTRITLGTGTPTPSPERQGSGYLFEVGDDVANMEGY